MTNVLLVTLITLIGFIGRLALVKINDLIKDVKMLLTADVINKNNISNIEKRIDHMEVRIDSLEKYN